MDELHMLADEGRGYILELMATKLLSLEQNIQLIGMSATLHVGLTEVGMPGYLLISNRM
jgi:DNA polymerase theta